MVAMSSLGGLGFLTGSNILTGIGFGADFLGAVFSAGLNHIENKNKGVSFKVENIFK